MLNYCCPFLDDLLDSCFVVGEPTKHSITGGLFYLSISTTLLSLTGIAGGCLSYEQKGPLQNGHFAAVPFFARKWEIGQHSVENLLYFSRGSHSKAGPSPWTRAKCCVVIQLFVTQPKYRTNAFVIALCLVLSRAFSGQKQAPERTALFLRSSFLA